MKMPFLLGVVAISGLACAFDAEKGLADARAAQLRQTTERVLPVRIVRFAKNAVSDPENLLVVDGRCARMSTVGGRVATVTLDLGEASASGYAVLHVKAFSGGRTPLLRISYANYPEFAEQRRAGDFSGGDRACYMGRDVVLPVLPANPNRFELYSIPRTGAVVAPLHQGQFRYATLWLESDDTEVELDAVEWLVGNYYDRQDFAGYFKSSDRDLDRHWQIGAWTCQLATMRDVAAWRAIDGRLLPRQLEKSTDVGLCSTAKMSSGGSLVTEFELRQNPAQLARIGFAFFAKDTANALLMSLDQNGIVRWVRRVNGRDELLREKQLNGIALVDCQIYHYTFKFKPIGGNSAKGYQIEMRHGNRFVDTFTYLHNPQGDRFGFWTPKGCWPVVDWVEVRDARQEVVFRDDFDDVELGHWDFVRPQPFVADGAKRDRLIWSGDLWWAGRNIYYSLGDAYGMRESIKLLARAQTPDGYIHACPYAESPTPCAGDYGLFESDEFAAWFVPVLCDYWLYTGDRQTLDAVWPTLVKLMDYLDAHTGKDGLFEQRLETSKHALATNLQKGDVSRRAYMDILLWACRQQAAKLAEAKGCFERAAKWRTAAVHTQEAVFKAYWLLDRGCFRARVGDDALGAEANALALAFRLLPAERAKGVAKAAVERQTMAKFVVMGAFGKAAYGDGEDAWQTIVRRNWKEMLSKRWIGPLTTPEVMILAHGGNGDQSHPDTALAGLISTEFLGIVPLEPGFAAFAFEPHPPAKLTFAEGRVPTPHGSIDARWEKVKDGTMRYELTVPVGTKCLLNGKTFGPGSYRCISDRERVRHD